MDLNTLYNQESRELILKDEIIRLIQNFNQDNKTKTAKELRRYIEEFTYVAEAVIRGLEAFRIATLNIERQKISDIEQLLLKRKVYDEELTRRVAEIKKRIDQTINEDKTFVRAFMRSGSQTSKVIAIRDIMKRGQYIAAVSGQDSSLAQQAKQAIDQYNKIPLTQRVIKAGSLKQNLKEKIKELLTRYLNEFDQSFAIAVEINSTENRIINDAHTVYAATQRIASYFQLNDLQEKLLQLTERMRRLISNSVVNEAGNEQYLQRIENELMEKEKTSLEFSLLRPDTMQQHKADENPTTEWYCPNDTQIMVHLTNYFPVNGIVFPTMKGAVIQADPAIQYPRNTLHFSVNHAVRDVTVNSISGISNYSWEGKKYAVLVPMRNFPKERIANFDPTDTYILGELKIPAGSILVARRMSLQKDVIGKRFRSIQNIETFFRKKGIKLIVIEDEPIASYVNQLISEAGRHVAPNLLSSEYHYMHEIASAGRPDPDTEGYFNIIDNIMLRLSSQEAFLKEDNVNDLLDPYSYEEIRQLLHRTANILEAYNLPANLTIVERERRKVLLVNLDKTIKAISMVARIMELQVSAAENSHIDRLPYKEKTFIGIALSIIFERRIVEECLEGELYSRISAAALKLYPNTRKELMFQLNLCRARCEELVKTIKKKYSDLLPSWENEYQESQSKRRWDPLSDPDYIPDLLNSIKTAIK